MKLRDWATPLTIGGFVLIAVTGILMFFHLDSGLNKLAHEWLGWVLVAAVGLHVAANMGMVRRHFADRRALAIMGVCLVALAGSFVSLPGGGREASHAMAINALLDAPVDVVARVAGKDALLVRSQLRGAGIEADTGQSLRQAAGDGRDRQMRALGLVLAK